MDVNPLPEFNPPIFDTFYYGGQAVVLDVEVLSNFQLRNNGAFGFVYYGRIPGRLSIEIAAKVCWRDERERNEKLLNFLVYGSFSFDY